MATEEVHLDGAVSGSREEKAVLIHGQAHHSPQVPGQQVLLRGGQGPTAIISPGPCPYPTGPSAAGLLQLH